MNFYDSLSFKAVIHFILNLTAQLTTKDFLSAAKSFTSAHFTMLDIFPITTEENTEQCNYLREIISKIIKCWQKKFINLTT